MVGTAKTRGEKIWKAYPLLGALALGVYFFLLPSAAQDYLYLLVGLSSAVAVGLGVLLNRPSHALAWCLLALGPLCSFIGDVIYSFYEVFFHTEVPYPSVADVFYVAMYPLIIAGMLVIQRQSVGGWTMVIDPLIVATGAGLLSWVFLMQPFVEGETLSFMAMALSITLPLMDVVLLAVLARMLMTPGKRVPAFYLLSASVVSLLAAEMLYGYQALEGTYQPGGLVDAGFLIFYVLFGMTGLHPSMRALSEPAPVDGSAKLTRRRLALLAAAALTAPALMVAQPMFDDYIDTLVVAAGAAVMFLLALLRMEGMINALSRSLKEREALQSELEHQALHDSLTGLANRALFADRLAHAFSLDERLSGGLAVLMLDIDNFKSINDDLGHEAGDRLLASVAKRIRACARRVDTVARLGGDEFAVLLEQISDASAAGRVAEQILAALGKPHMLGDKEVFVCASIGVASSISREANPDDLLRDADVALYAAKGKGKMRCEFFEPGMRAMKVRQRETEAELRRALEKEEFTIHYQPIVSLKTGKIVEVEALVRWQHPERGLLSPAEFLPTAEVTGLIVPIGQWVIREACRQVKAWTTEDAAASDLTLAVNLSAKELKNASLVENITEALEESGLDPHSLKLEITEHAAVEDTETATQKLTQFYAMGLRIALDDFGAGYSALTYLKSFPVDTLKIDRSFVDGIGSDLRSTSIVGAIIALAKTLGLSVIAEGAETQEQLDQLRSLGCDLAQGSHFSMPLAREDMGAMFKAAADAHLS